MATRRRSRPKRIRAVRRARLRRYEANTENPARRGFWLPQVMFHRIAGALRYGVHEVHFVVPRTVCFWTQRSLSPLFGTVAELNGWIVATLNAAGDDPAYPREDLELWLRHIHDRPLAFD